MITNSYKQRNLLIPLHVASYFQNDSICNCAQKSTELHNYLPVMLPGLMTILRAT